MSKKDSVLKMLRHTSIRLGIIEAIAFSECVMQLLAYCSVLNKNAITRAVDVQNIPLTFEEAYQSVIIPSMYAITLLVVIIGCIIEILMKILDKKKHNLSKEIGLLVVSYAIAGLIQTLLIFTGLMTSLMYAMTVPAITALFIIYFSTIKSSTPEEIETA